MKQVFKMCSMQNILRITYIRIWRFQTLEARRRWYKFVHIHQQIRMESYILVYSNLSLLIKSNNIVFMIFGFSNKSHKINKMANIFLNKIDLHTFLTSRNTINHRKKPMFVNVSFGLHAYGMQLLPTKIYNAKISAST